MSLIDVARDALKEIPMADILRERFSLALDQSASLEKKTESLQAENAELKAELKIARQDIENKESELQRRREEYAEEVRIHRTIEFRKGKRTGGKWLPFCPRCHLPIDTTTGLFICPDEKCGFHMLLLASDLPKYISEL